MQATVFLAPVNRCHHIFLEASHAICSFRRIRFICIYCWLRCRFRHIF